MRYSLNRKVRKVKMFFHEKTYDIDELVRMNMHIHTTFSGCAKPEMTVSNILKTAEEAGLNMIALTDHDNSALKNIVAERRKLLLDEIGETRLRVLVGAELSCTGIGKFLNDEECDLQMDYKLYTMNHFHVSCWDHPEDVSPRGYAVQMLKMAESVIEMRKADCFAHPFMPGYIKTLPDRNLVTEAYTDNELGDIMEKATKKEIAWELNTSAIMGFPDFFHRYFQIGKEVGAVFNIGTDAHKLCNVDPHQFADRLKEILY